MKGRRVDRLRLHQSLFAEHSLKRDGQGSWSCRLPTVLSKYKRTLNPTVPLQVCRKNHLRPLRHVLLGVTVSAYSGPCLTTGAYFKFSWSSDAIFILRIPLAFLTVGQYYG